jgi:hypothetical protein
MPPSPRLSSRMMIRMYLTLTIRMRDQTISERTPYTAVSVRGRPYSGLKHARNA